MSGFDQQRYDEACAIRASADCLIDEAGLSACYDRMAQKLVQLFIDNFEPFAAHVDKGVRDAAPQAA